jgi:hypothetical protein
LRLRLIGLMVNDLCASGHSKELACVIQIPKIWAAIGEPINGESILRMERRRRR